MRATSRLMVAVAALLGAVGCSLPTDRAPQAIAPDDVPFDLLGETEVAPEAEPGPDTREVSLYFVADEALREVERVLPDTGDEAVIRSLLAGRTADDPVTFSSAIPSGVRLLGIRREGAANEVLVLDLSAEINAIQGPGLQQAVAQLTFTALDLRGVEAVRFALEGEPFNVGTADGRPDVVDDSDFRDLLVIPAGDGAADADTPRPR